MHGLFFILPIQFEMFFLPYGAIDFSWQHILHFLSYLSPKIIKREHEKKKDI